MEFFPLKMSNDVMVTPSEEQRRVIQQVLTPHLSEHNQTQRRHPIFVTGLAGAGKTAVTKLVIDGFVNRFGLERVLVTAMTGVAATHYESGRTLHSVFGLGKGDMSLEECQRKLTQNKTLITSIRNAKVLIIDEISYIDRELLKNLRHLLHFARGERNADEKSTDIGHDSFAGMLLIMVGDWMQLVQCDRTQLPFLTYRRSHDKSIINSLEELAIFTKLANIPGSGKGVVYKKYEWANFEVHMLKDIKRQDGRLARFMNNIRYGTDRMTDADFDVLRDLIKPKQWPEGCTPVQLHAKKSEAKKVNESELRSLIARTGGELLVYTAIDKLSLDCSSDSTSFQPRPDIDDLLTNVPIEISCAVGQPIMCLKNSPKDQLVNGSQGVVTRFLYKSEADQIGLKTFGKFEACKRYPLVRFFARGALPERMVLIGVSVFTLESAPGVSYFTREQLPVMPAWALTVHKAQGLGIDYLIIDVTDFFAENQFYAAITRAMLEEFTELRGISEQQVNLLQRWKRTTKYSRKDKPNSESDEKLLASARNKFRFLFDAGTTYKQQWDDTKMHAFSKTKADFQQQHHASKKARN
jgi:ATP-dependent DNA helicase PIF1